MAMARDLLILNLKPNLRPNLKLAIMVVMEDMDEDIMDMEDIVDITVMARDLLILNLKPKLDIMVVMEDMVVMVDMVDLDVSMDKIFLEKNKTPCSSSSWTENKIATSRKTKLLAAIHHGLKTK